jgi:hypothetical protein
MTSSTAAIPEGEIKRGPETADGTLSWFEAPIDGSMVGTENPTAKTLGLWTFPSTDSGCGFSPCLAGTAQAAKFRLPQTIRVTCVTIGQKVRNGVAGHHGYYEDDRWLKTVPNPNFEGTGFLSNVWFARDKLPPNLAKCP